jgi:hypothetical protein
MHLNDFAAMAFLEVTWTFTFPSSQTVSHQVSGALIRDRDLVSSSLVMVLSFMFVLVCCQTKNGSSWRSNAKTPSREEPYPVIAACLILRPHNSHINLHSK